MPKAVDWDALAAVFAPPQPDTKGEDAVARHSSGTVTYNGEQMPRWLARDLTRERAAIREYDGGMSRAKAEELTRRGFE
ncbi:MAG: hypothetical protein JKY94_07420 [Rhodobacteraceae bacterium]|nr:hypothetical protein [Paracoccaceae bacterium]